MLKKQRGINKQDFKNRLHLFCQMIMILTHFYLALVFDPVFDNDVGPTLVQHWHNSY